MDAVCDEMNLHILYTFILFLFPQLHFLIKMYSLSWLFSRRKLTCSFFRERLRQVNGWTDAFPVTDGRTEEREIGKFLYRVASLLNFYFPFFGNLGTEKSSYVHTFYCCTMFRNGRQKWNSVEFECLVWSCKDGFVRWVAFLGLTDFTSSCPKYQGWKVEQQNKADVQKGK